MASDHEVLTVKEVCGLLRVHSATVYKLVKNGSIPSFRIGSDWRFRREVIERWIAEHTLGT
jgi:excisionase family DNA binding protein